MLKSEIDVFTSEFRHEQVRKFLVGLMDGSVRIVPMTEHINEQTRKKIMKIFRELEGVIGFYISGLFKGEVAENFETTIFHRILEMRLFNLIEQDNVPLSRIETDIIEIRSSLESNNKLLTDLIDIMRELVDKLGQ